MARSSRARGGMRRKRMRLDWVVNQDTYGESSQISVLNGTVVAIPLTYPKSLTAQAFNGPGITREGAAWPDAGRQYVAAVRGWYRFLTTSWVAGNGINVICRIVKKPMDWASLGAITDVAYSLYDALYANERFAWQRLHFDVFAAGTEYTNTFSVKATVKQWLEPDEALYFVMQNESGTNQTITFQHFHRTLMGAND